MRKTIVFCITLLAFVVACVSTANASAYSVWDFLGEDISEERVLVNYFYEEYGEVAAEIAQDAIDVVKEETGSETFLDSYFIHLVVSTARRESSFYHTISIVTNNDGTTDYGYMQINTVNIEDEWNRRKIFDEEYWDLSHQELRSNITALNRAGTRLLWNHTRKMSVYGSLVSYRSGIGAYRSGRFNPTSKDYAKAIIAHAQETAAQYRDERHNYAQAIFNRRVGTASRVFTLKEVKPILMDIDHVIYHSNMNHRPIQKNRDIPDNPEKMYREVDDIEIDKPSVIGFIRNDLTDVFKYTDKSVVIVVKDIGGNDGRQQC
jgi:hypothetical protein